MKADLHVHSCYSNGFFHPKELLSLATTQEVNHLAIVDHHTFAGIEAVKEVFYDSPVNLIEGIEISAFDLKRQKDVRILGYNLSNRSYIEQLCRPLLHFQTNQTLCKLKKLQAEGYRLKEEELWKEAETATALYPCHLYRLLKKRGYGTQMNPLFYQKLMTTEEVSDDRKKINVYDAIEAIKYGGGLTILACPGKFDNYDLIPELASFGIDGLEKYHPAHRLRDLKVLSEFIQTYHFSCFGGSDFHGIRGTAGFGRTLITDTREFPDQLLCN